MADLEKEITGIVAEIVEMEEGELWEKRSHRFVEQMGVDSMLALEMLAVLERRFKIEIPEEEILDLTSLDATIALVRRKLGQEAAA